MASKDSDRSKWLVPDMPADALVEIQGKGLFVNSTGKPYEAPVEDENKGGEA
jgi:hypothetical protein